MEGPSVQQTAVGDLISGDETSVRLASTSLFQQDVYAAFQTIPVLPLSELVFQVPAYWVVYWHLFANRDRGGKHTGCDDPSRGAELFHSGYSRLDVEPC